MVLSISNHYTSSSFEEFREAEQYERGIKKAPQYDRGASIFIQVIL
jgi:hypothetical protein